MTFTVITLFPEFIEALHGYSIIGRAIAAGKIALKTINLRDFGLGKYKQVDDRPYGGGAGMLLRVDVVSKAIRAAREGAKKRHRVILLCPSGKKFTQRTAERLAKLDEIILVCGHYEGFDKRIEGYVDEKISVGDYVLSGGEVAAMAVVDATSRQIPGVLQNPKSLELESFSRPAPESKKGRIAAEHPQYTRPREFEGKGVPEVLISGNHQEIDEWRRKGPCA